MSKGAGRYLRNPIDQYSGNLSPALAAYNAVPDVVTRYRDPDRVTQQYDKEQIR